MLLKIHESSNIMWLFAIFRILVQPLDRSFSIHHLLFVLQHSASLDTSAEYLLQCLSLHLFHTLVFTPQGIIMLQVNKYVLSTSLQKWAKQVFLNHYSTYTVDTSHACLLSFNWNIKSEAKLLLNDTTSVNSLVLCLASKSTTAFCIWDVLMAQKNDLKILPA